MSSRTVVRGIGFFLVGCLLGSLFTHQWGQAVLCGVVALVLSIIASEMDDE